MAYTIAGLWVCVRLVCQHGKFLVIGLNRSSVSSLNTGSGMMSDYGKLGKNPRRLVGNLDATSTDQSVGVGFSNVGFWGKEGA